MRVATEEFFSVMHSCWCLTGLGLDLGLAALVLVLVLVLYFWSWSWSYNFYHCLLTMDATMIMYRAKWKFGDEVRLSRGGGTVWLWGSDEPWTDVQEGRRDHSVSSQVGRLVGRFTQRNHRTRPW